MATAIDFPERNDWIGKPPSMTDNQCYSLPVCRIVNNIPGAMPMDPPVQEFAHVSCWEFTPEELEAIARTGRAYLKISGWTTFPLSVHGILPIHTDQGQYSELVLTETQIKKLKEGQ